MLNTNSPAKTTEIAGNGKLTAEMFEAAGIPVTKSRPSVTTPGTFGTNARTKDFFEATIAGTWQKSVQGIFDTGKWLLAAKEELDPEVFKALRLPFGPRTKQRLMATAGNVVIATHVSQLPPHWGTLYALSRIDDKVLLAKFRDNTISPSLERREIRTKILGLPSTTRTKIATPVATPASVTKVESKPIIAATDAATAAMAAVEAKDVEWLLRVLPKAMRAKLRERVAMSDPISPTNVWASFSTDAKRAILKSEGRSGLAALLSPELTVDLVDHLIRQEMVGASTKLKPAVSLTAILRATLDPALDSNTVFARFKAKLSSFGLELHDVSIALKRR